MGSAVPIDSPAKAVRTQLRSADNEIFVTDYVDNSLRVLNVGSVMTAPQANGQPTVGTPDAETGAVTGDFMVTTPTGTQLSYTVSDAPNKGT